MTASEDGANDLANLRVVRLDGPVYREMANAIIAQLLFLERLDRDRPITLEIDSPGGELTAGMAVADTVLALAPPVHTHCTGAAHGTAAVVLACGTPGHRSVGPDAVVSLAPVIPDPSRAVDGDEFERTVRIVAEVVAQQTGRTADEVVELTAAGGRRFDAAGAVAFGLADRVEGGPAGAMTATEWETSVDPTRMLYAVRPWASERKLRLFALACGRRVWDTLPDQVCRAAIEVAERHVDGRATDAELRATCDQAVDNNDEDLRRPVPHDTAFLAAEIARSAAAEPDPDRPDETYAAATRVAVLAEIIGVPDSDPGAVAAIVRDVFGRPVRPVPFAPEWRSADVLALAEGMYESRDFGPMPVLADALEDAGCADADVLNHCRGPGPHVRGCWVVDGLTGRA